jgi:non-heme chloroperoxidase
MSTVITNDGTEIYYKDWGEGRPVLLSHGWPLSSDSWEAQMLFLAEHGFRVIAHDRRGHGRSTQTWHGNEMDTYADDLACLIDTLDLQELTMVGFSTGGGEVVRYLGRHGTGRIARVVLVSAVPPFMLRTDDNPDGVPVEVFDGIRAGSLTDRSQTYHDLADGPFFGNNREGQNPSQGMRDAFWLQGMQAGHRNAYECIAAFSATDFRADLDAIDVPVYPGAPHGITDTHKEQLSADLLEFLNS